MGVDEATRASHRRLTELNPRAVVSEANVTDPIDVLEAVAQPVKAR